MLFKEIIAVYSENHTKPINTNAALEIERVKGRLWLSSYE
jgi:hypothetical protein